MRASLHKTQEKLLDLLAKNAEDPLTIRQLKDFLDLSSTNLVHHHISQLEKKGYLKRNPNNRADYQVLQNPDLPISFINLYGLAKCGPNGNILDGKPIDRIPISSSLINFPIDEAFFVRAEGNSMEPEIKNNDLVLARMKTKCSNGDVVICTINEQTIIKRFRKLDSKNIILESYNNSFDPIVLTMSDKINVQGILKGLIRI